MTIVVLISTYLLLNLSRLIVNFFEKITTPWIYKITDKNSIILKIEYENLGLDRDRVQKKYEAERESRLRLESEIENLESKLKKEFDSSLATKSENEREDNDEEKLVKLLENKGFIEVFESLIFSTNNKEWVQEDDSHRLLVTIGLIKRDKKNGDHGVFNFTDKGRNFEKY